MKITKGTSLSNDSFHLIMFYMYNCRVIIENIVDKESNFAYYNENREGNKVSDDFFFLPYYV